MKYFLLFVLLMGNISNIFADPPPSVNHSAHRPPVFRLESAGHYREEPPFALLQERPNHPRRRVLIFPGVRTNLAQMRGVVTTMKSHGDAVSIAVPRSQLEDYIDGPDFTVEDARILVQGILMQQETEPVDVIATSLSATIVEGFIARYTATARRVRKFIFINPVIQNLVSPQASLAAMSSPVVREVPLQMPVATSRGLQQVQIQLPTQFFRYYFALITAILAAPLESFQNVPREVFISRNDPLFDKAANEALRIYSRLIALGYDTEILLREAPGDAHNVLRHPPQVVTEVLDGKMRSISNCGGIVEGLRRSADE